MISPEPNISVAVPSTSAVTARAVELPAPLPLAGIQVRAAVVLIGAGLMLLSILLSGRPGAEAPEESGVPSWSDASESATPEQEPEEVHRPRRRWVTSLLLEVCREGEASDQGSSQPVG